MTSYDVIWLLIEKLLDKYEQQQSRLDSTNEIKNTKDNSNKNR